MSASSHTLLERLELHHRNVHSASASERQGARDLSEAEEPGETSGTGRRGVHQTLLVSD